MHNFNHQLLKVLRSSRPFSYLFDSRDVSCLSIDESIYDVIVALPADPRDKAHPTGASSPASGSVPQISPLLRLPQNHVPQEAAKRGQEMPQSVRHGKQRPVVHPV